MIKTPLNLKPIVVLLILSSGIVMTAARATNLETKNWDWASNCHGQKCAPFTKGDDDVWRLLDSEGNPYEDIVYTHTVNPPQDGGMQGGFILADNKNVVVEATNITVNHKNNQDSAITLKNNSSVQLNVKKGLSIKGVNYSGIALLRIEDNGRSEFTVNADSINIDATVSYLNSSDGEKDEVSNIPYDNILAFGLDSQGVMNLQGKTINLTGSIINGFVKYKPYPPETEEQTGLAGNKDSTIYINDQSQGTLVLKGDVYTGNSGNYRNNLNILVFPNKQSLLTGAVEDHWQINKDKEGTHLTFKGGSRWNMTRDSLPTNVELTESQILVNFHDQEFPKDKPRKLKIQGDLFGNNGTIVLDIDAGTNNQNDRVYIKGVHTGNHYIALNNINAEGKTDGAEGAVLVTVNEENGTFSVPESEEGHLYWNHYSLAKVPSKEKGFNFDWILKTDRTSELTTGTQTILASQTNAFLTWRFENDTLLKRLGELRQVSQPPSALWARIKGRQARYDDEVFFKHHTDGIEIGFDRQISKDVQNPHYLGVSLSALRGSSDYKQGTGKDHAYFLTVYDTHIYQDNRYLDLVAKVGKLDYNFDVIDTQDHKLTSDFSRYGLALSAEYGKKYFLSQFWFVDPQAQFTWSALKGGNYQTSNGIKINQKTTYSAVARLGFNVGRVFDQRGDLYLKANLYHDFLGKVKSLTSFGQEERLLTNQPSATWVDLGVGTNVHLRHNLHLYMDLEARLAKHSQHDVSWNVGIRWNLK